MGLFSGVEEAAMREPNLEKLNALVGKLVGDLGISLGGASILLGDRLGLYKAMADGAAGHSVRACQEDRPARALCARMAVRPGRVRIHRLPPRKKRRSHSRPSKPWRSPKKGRRRSSPVHSMSCNPPISTNPRSPKRFEPGKALAGTSIRSACSRAPNASSGRAITPISSRTGFRRSRASRRS